MPATLDTLRAFLRARIATGKRRATLELNVSTLAMVHTLVGLSWPLDTMAGKLMWRGIRRSLPARQHQKRGLSIDDIERMLAPLDPAVPRDARDGTATVLIQKGKEGQEGQGCVKALPAGTTRRLRHWLSISRSPASPKVPCFVLHRDPNSHTTSLPRLSDRDVARIYKRRVAAVGLEATQIAGNSTRIGAAQDLMAAGFSSYRSKNYPGRNYRGEKQRAKIRA